MTLHVPPLRYNVTLRSLCYDYKVWHMSTLTQYYVKVVALQLSSHSENKLKKKATGAVRLTLLGLGFINFLSFTTRFEAIMMD